jgi:hypothetical protein
MSNAYFKYVGVGGIWTGSVIPLNGVMTTSEITLAQTTVPDLRESVGQAVLITANIYIGSTAASAGTFKCRQSTLGTIAATGSLVLFGGNTGTGTYVASIGTLAGTLGAGQDGVLTMQWIDYTPTNPLSAYQVTGLCAAGNATIAAAFITAEPLPQ